MSDTFYVTLWRDDENKWIVDSSEFCVSNWRFAVPGGDTKVKIDGIELPSSTPSESYDGIGIKKAYTIECIGKSPKTITVIAEDSFGTAEFKVNPTAEYCSEPYVFTVKMNDEKAYTAIENIWNSCYKDIVNGKQASDLMKYVTANADAKMISNTIFKGITEQALKKDFGNCNNFVCSNVRPCSHEERQSEWLSDKIALVYFNYDMTWLHGTADSAVICDKLMKSFTNVMISFEDEKYKISNPGENFFSCYNESINDLG